MRSVSSECRSAQDRLRSYAARTRRADRSTQPGSRAARRRASTPCSIRAHIIGVSVSETTIDISTATESVSANSRKRRPIRSPISRIGMKTATSERLIETTVEPTSRAPASAAVAGGSPRSTWRAVFSATTMASSTTNPAAMMSAISERLFRLNPARYMKPKVVTSETGTAIAGIMVARQSRRKASTTRMTSSTERSNVFCTSWMEARTVEVRSSETRRFIDGGSDSRSTGRSASMPLAVSMMLALGSR